MRRTGRHAHGAVRTGEVAEWTTRSPGANLDSEAGPERIARRASLRMRRAYAPDGPPRPRCSENRRGGRVVDKFAWSELGQRSWPGAHRAKGESQDETSICAGRAATPTVQ